MDFPLEEGNSWGFTLFSIEWQADVTDVSGDYVTIRADADDGGRLDYAYDRSAGVLLFLHLEGLLWHGTDADDAGR